MLMRARPLEELDDQRVIDIQERGRLLDEEYNQYPEHTKMINKDLTMWQENVIKGQTKQV